MCDTVMMEVFENNSYNLIIINIGQSIKPFNIIERVFVRIIDPIINCLDLNESDHFTISMISNMFSISNFKFSQLSSSTQFKSIISHLV